MAKRKHTPAPWETWSILILEVLGFAIAFYLLLVSARVINPENLPCPSKGIFACSSIVRGKFSYFGPFSIAALGTVYFAAQIALTALARSGNWAVWLKALMIVGGYGFLGWLRATEIVYLHKICPWCYAVCLLTLMEAVALWPALTQFLPRWGVAVRSLAVFGAFVAVSLMLCVPALLLKTAENCYGRQWFPFDYTKLAEGGTPIEHEIDLTPANTSTDPQRTPVPTRTPTATKTPVPVANPKVPGKITDSASNSDEVKILRNRGWRVVDGNQSVLNAIKSKPPVLLLAFDPICDECAYLIHNQLSNPVTEDIPATRIAVVNQQLLGSLAMAVDGVPKLLLLDGEGNILWQHKGRLDAMSLVSEVKKALEK